jgi:glycerol-3-phosphate dehydrogenase
MSVDQRPWDVVIVGAGVTGTAIAARLSRTTASVIVVEAAGDVAEGASKGNAGVAPSYYAAPGTLEAALTSASYPRWEEVCRNLDVTYRRIGGLMVAINDEQVAALPQLLEEARGCGAEAHIVDGAEVRRLEPLVTADAIAGLWLPEEGVIDPMRLTVGYAELAARNGVPFRFQSPVTGFDLEAGAIHQVHAGGRTIGARFVVNASGVAAGRISRLAGGETFRLWPRKGEYWLLDREFGQQMQRIVFAIPSSESKGIHVVPTTHGNALLGPSSDDIDDPEDKSTNEDVLSRVFELARRLVPSVTQDDAIKVFAANRPASEERVRVGFDASVGNMLHAINRSSGVGSSLGTADHVLGLLRQAGLDADDRPGAWTAIPSVPRLHNHPAPETLTTIDPRYGQVVCVCEQVSAAEIAAALESNIPAATMDGIRKRTRATAGRCQGSICAAGVAFMCSLRYGLPPEQIAAIDHGLLGVDQ